MRSQEKLLGAMPKQERKVNVQGLSSLCECLGAFEPKWVVVCGFTACARKLLLLSCGIYSCFSFL